MKAILRNREVIPVDDLDVWGNFILDIDGRTVAKTEIDKVVVSTVFLGLDHGWGVTPLWFETMIFGGEHDQFQKRYETYEQAEMGHLIAVELLKRKRAPLRALISTLVSCFQSALSFCQRVLFRERS